MGQLQTRACCKKDDGEFMPGWNELWGVEKTEDGEWMEPIKKKPIKKKSPRRDAPDGERKSGRSKAKESVSPQRPSEEWAGWLRAIDNLDKLDVDDLDDIPCPDGEIEAAVNKADFRVDLDVLGDAVKSPPWANAIHKGFMTTSVGSLYSDDSVLMALKGGNKVKEEIREDSSVISDISFDGDTAQRQAETKTRSSAASNPQSAQKLHEVPENERNDRNGWEKESVQKIDVLECSINVENEKEVDGDEGADPRAAFDGDGSTSLLVDRKERLGIVDAGGIDTSKMSLESLHHKDDVEKKPDDNNIRASAEGLLRRVSFALKRSSNDGSLESSIRALHEAHRSTSGSLFDSAEEEEELRLSATRLLRRASMFIKQHEALENERNNRNGGEKGSTAGTPDPGQNIDNSEVSDAAADRSRRSQTVGGEDAVRDRGGEAPQPAEGIDGPLLPGDLALLAGARLTSRMVSAGDENWLESANWDDSADWGDADLLAPRLAEGNGEARFVKRMSDIAEDREKSWGGGGGVPSEHLADGGEGAGPRAAFDGEGSTSLLMDQMERLGDELLAKVDGWEDDENDGSADPGEAGGRREGPRPERRGTDALLLRMEALNVELAEEMDNLNNRLTV